MQQAPVRHPAAADRGADDDVAEGVEANRRASAVLAERGRVHVGVEGDREVEARAELADQIGVCPARLRRRRDASPRGRAAPEVERPERADAERRESASVVAGSTASRSGSAQDFMYFVGGVEIAAGLIVAVAPVIGAPLVAAWLAGIVVNLLTNNPPEYYDIALRDFGLMLAALTLARLAWAVTRSAAQPNAVSYAGPAPAARAKTTLSPFRPRGSSGARR